MIDAKKIKKDFPIFERYEKAHGKPLAYLDSAASSQTPRLVVEAMDAYYYDFRSNVHRSPYDLGTQATEAYEGARATVANFIGAMPSEVIFTAGATAGVNMLAGMLGRHLNLKAGDEVLTTVSEHHSNFVPFQELANQAGAKFRTIPLKGTDFDYKMAISMLTPRTKIVTLPLAGNVLGTIHDAARFIQKAKDAGALVIVDASKAAGHMRIDVKALGCDFLFFSGHKMLGPTGIGVLYGRLALLEALLPSSFGGGTVSNVNLVESSYKSSPEKFEAGTPNVAGAIGLAAAVSYLEALGMEEVRAHSEALVKYATEKLSAIPGVTVVSERDEKKNIGIVSFSVNGVHPHDVAEIVGRDGVAIRGGHHCAMPLMAHLRLPSGVCRASFYIYSRTEDVDALIEGLRKVKQLFS